jgi:hypothetical protein
MGYQLPSMLTTVNYQPVSALSNAMLPGQLIGDFGHVPDERYIGLGQLQE